MREKVRLRSWIPFVLAVAAVAVTVALNLPAAAGGPAAAPAQDGAVAAARVPVAARPIANDCSGGLVYLTFDDGPGPGTPLVLDTLAQLNLRATFFVIGDHIAGNEAIIRREVAAGNSVQNHTYHHFNLADGVDVDGVQRYPWGPSEVATELVRTDDAIVAAGAPRPTEYRPPYGSVTGDVDAVAAKLGLRLVMPWSDDGSGNIVDSKDTEGVTADDIIANLTPGVRSDAIVAMHDGETASATGSAGALQAVVDVMNREHLCSSTDIRPDATGDILLQQQSGTSVTVTSHS